MFFRTDQTGPMVFLLWESLWVSRVDPYPAAVAQAIGFWDTHPVPTIAVAPDVGDWLAQLP